MCKIAHYDFFIINELQYIFYSSVFPFVTQSTQNNIELRSKAFLVKIETKTETTQQIMSVNFGF